MSRVSKPGLAPLPSILFTDYVFSRRQIALFQAALIAVATFWVYSPALGGDWLWDDAMYLSHNALLDQPDRLAKAWFQPGSFIEYYPIEQTVQWLQWRLWGNGTLPYHLTNVFLQIVNALLFWRVLAKVGVKLAWIGGLIFAVHPANVESVAWISELKNCLSLTPALLAMSAWIDYDAARRARDFRLCLAFFLTSMLCKITLAMFPFIILLYAWWKRGRVEKRDLWAALIFLAISALLVALTIQSGALYMHHLRQSPAPIPIGGPLARLALAGTTASFYFAESFLPIVLLPIYPQWQVNPPLLVEILPWFGFGLALVWLWTKRAGWGRSALFGLGFFFINLAPFSGVHGISYMSFTWVMDHFLYLPALGLIGLVAAALGDLDQRLAAWSQAASTALITLVLALLAFHAHWYAAAFTNDETLWTYTLERNPGAWLAANNMGKIEMTGGDPAKAADYFAAAVAQQPQLAELHGNLGHALAQLGQVDEGLAEMRQALRLDPYDAAVNNNLGILLARAGKTDDAIVHFITSLRSKPDDPETYTNLGNVFFGLGRLDDAAGWYGRALRLKPADAEARYNLGSVRLQQGRPAEAVAQFEQALQTRPDYVEAHNNLGIALAQLGRTAEAITQFAIVLQLDPDNRIARDNLAGLRAGTPGAAK